MAVYMATRTGPGRALLAAQPGGRSLAAMSLRKFAETTEAYGHRHSGVHMVPVLDDPD